MPTDFDGLLDEVLTDAQRAEYGEYAGRLRQVETADLVYCEQTWHEDRLAELGHTLRRGGGEVLAFIGELVTDHERKKKLCAAEMERRARRGAFPPSGLVVLDYSGVRRAIKERTLELIDTYVPLVKTGREYRGLCPFHDDHHPSLRVNAEKGLWYCDPCASGGDVFDFVMRLGQYDFTTTLRLLAVRAGISLPRWQPPGGAEPPKTSPAGGSPQANAVTVEDLINAIPIETNRLQLARALNPILVQLAVMPRAEAEAVLWHAIKPHFHLTCREIQGYGRALSELRRAQKAQTTRGAQAQPAPESHEPREDAERRQRLARTPVSFTDLHACLREVLGEAGDLLEVVLAASAIPNVKPPVWLFVVGAPSSGKTELVRLLRASPHVYYLDTLTENAFVSGYIRSDGSDPKDLLPWLNGKAFVCKDLTTLFSLKEETITKLLGDLSSIYDGEFRKHTATRGSVSYTSSFSMIACITPAALNKHQRYLNMIGARFLTYRVPPLTAIQIDQGFDALRHKSNRATQLDALREAVSAYGFQLSQENIASVHLEQDTLEYLKQLAKLLARGRGVIVTNRTKFKDAEGQEREWAEVIEAQIEEPWRGYQQIESLTRALALVHQRDRVTAHELELARRVVLASMPPARGDALAHFADPAVRQRGYVVAGDIGERMDTSPRSARRLLEELHALRILTKEKVGTEAARFAPCQEFAKLIFDPRPPIDHIADYPANRHVGNPDTLEPSDTRADLRSRQG